MPAVAPPDEAARLRALMSCSILDTPPEKAFDDLTRLATSLCDAPIAVVSLVDANRVWFKSRIGLDVAEIPRKDSFCSHGISLNEPLIIPDATLDPRFASGELVAGGHGVRAYAGAPMRTSEGLRLGSFCIMDTKPREFTPQQIELLLTLAEQAAARLELLWTASQLDELNRALNRSREVAVEASASKSRFIANMSHEFRTPMTAIVGYAEVLGESDLDAERRGEAVEIIKKSSCHLLALINDVLDLSRIESDQLTLEQIPSDPRTIMHEAGQLLRHRAEARRIGFMVEIADDVPNKLIGDPLRIRQILINLVGNAIKFTSRGEVRVLMSVAENDRGKKRLRIEVSDTGIGIAREALDDMFLPFHQADASPTRNFGGCGLGLSISRRLAHIMGGEIRAESEPGRGSVFTLDLPVFECGDYKDIGVSDDALPEWPTDDETTYKQLNGRILLAEDSPDSQKLLGHILRAAGAEVEIVANGREAVTAAMQASAADCGYDLVLLDMQMPVLDGYCAARELREQGYDGSIAALTAHAMDEDRLRCLEAGCDDYIAKPIERTAFLATCRHWMLGAIARKGARAA